MTEVEREQFENERTMVRRAASSDAELRDLLACVAESEEFARRGPVPGPCPAWCQDKTGHRFNDCGQPDYTAGYDREHVRDFGDAVWIVQSETMVGGEAVLSAPQIGLSMVTNMMSSAEAAELGISLGSAAAVLRFLAVDGQES